jgi:hypothetical protein
VNKAIETELLFGKLARSQIEAADRAPDSRRPVENSLILALARRRRCKAALSPYQTRHIKRFGDYVFTVTAPEPFDADLITAFPLEPTSEEQAAIA